MNGTHQRLPTGEKVADLLDDPIAELIMRRDGVTREDVIGIMTEMRGRLFGTGQGCTPGPLGRRGRPIRLAA